MSDVVIGFLILTTLFTLFCLHLCYSDMELKQSSSTTIKIFASVAVGAIMGGLCSILLMIVGLFL